MVHVSLNIITWNGRRYLPDLLASIDQQTCRDFVVRVIDNGSNDGTVEYLTEQRPEIMLVRNVKNHGFAAGHNQAMRFALDHWSADDQANCFILCVNQDIILQPDFLENLLAEADVYPKTGSFSGKLLRAYRENLQDDVLQETVRSELLDSTGLRVDQWRRFTDRGAGEMDSGQYDSSLEIFGTSGALALYRASALVDVKLDEDYFDEDLFSYREDVDLAWRLQRRGWTARYVPTAVAYHWRGIYEKEKTGIFQRIKNRRAKRPYFAALSTRNHWLVLFKNESWGNFLSWPRIILLETTRFVYLIIFETRSLWIIFSVLRLLPKFWRKRRLVGQRSRVTARELRRWFNETSEKVKGKDALL